MKHPRLECLWKEHAEFGSDEHTLRTLGVFSDWLWAEAMPAGGIGPVSTPDEVDEMHVADSLMFALCPPFGSPESLLDVGSGAGLPGIPLALLLPGCSVVLLDRSGRRVSLIRRAIRILQLDNVEVRQGDITGWTDPVELVVSRASIPPSGLAAHLERIGPSRAIVAASRRGPVEVGGFSSVKISSRCLASPRWFLTMP